MRARSKPRPSKSGVRKQGRAALAIAAHPDDIEFNMAGTLLLLGQAGFELHYLTLANGSCGSMTEKPARIQARRGREAHAAAKVLGATYHPSMANDLELVYSIPLLRQVAAVIREVNPVILLTHPPQDYMEDHTICCRLAVTAAFARGMPNFRSSPSRPAVPGHVTIYHALPHGLRDPLRRRVVAGSYVNTTSVHAVKRQALAEHKSQKDWLDATQGMDSYLQAMDEMSIEVGMLSGRFEHAEGWRRHLHYGFCPANSDPLHEALGDHCWVDPEYEAGLELVGPGRTL